MKRSRRPSMNPPRPPAVAKQPNIAAAWASYEAMVLPPEAPAILGYAEFIGAPGTGAQLPVRTAVSNT